MNSNKEVYNLQSTQVGDFLAKGIVKVINKKKEFEIEAKIRSFSNSGKQRISQHEFINAEQYVNTKLEGSDHLVMSSFYFYLRLQQTITLGQGLMNILKQQITDSQFLLSFSFKDGYRLTFDVNKDAFVLEFKEKNSDKNTLKILCEQTNINLSIKNEMLIEDKGILAEYLKKLKNNEFEMFRIKVRKNYTSEYIQRCFSKVIQITNSSHSNWQNPSHIQNLQQAITNNIYCFIEQKLQNYKIKAITNGIFSSCFDQKNDCLITYEIEVEMVQIQHYFEQIVTKKDKKTLRFQINKFNSSISQIIDSLGFSAYKIPTILGNYINQCMK